jgi:integrase/recombinase XerC
VSNLRRIPYTKPLPAGAEVITRKGQRFARFKDRRGKAVEAPLNDDGTRVQLLSRKWYGEYKDADGVEQCVPLSTDKTAAAQMLADLVKKAELGKAGITDPYEAHRKRPLLCTRCRCREETDAGEPCDCPDLPHLADFAAALRAKGDTPKHVQLTLSRLRAALDGMEAVWLADLDAGKAGEWLTTFRADHQPEELPEGQELFKLAEVAALLGVKPAAVSKAVQRNQLAATGKGKKRRFPRATVQDLVDRAARGASAETVNHHARALRAFGRWLAGKRCPSNPFDRLALLNVATDRRHDRRELAADEMRRLLAVTEASTRAFRGLTGLDRAALYLTACGTGFRVRALAGLTPSDFDLTTDLPAVHLPARLAKNKKGKVQPLAGDVAEALRAYLDGRPEGSPVWPGTWKEDAAEMLRADLADAGIPYAVEGPDGPLYADFHALRHTYLTLGGRAGIDLRTLQELAGHSNPNLTVRYSHRRLHDLAGAVEKLPSILPSGKDKSETEAMRATGTDAGASLPGHAKGCQTGHTQGNKLQDKDDPQIKTATLSLRPACATAEAGRGSVRAIETSTRQEGGKGNRPQPPISEGVEAGCDHLRVVEKSEPAGTRTQDLRINLPHGLSPAGRGRCGLDFTISLGMTGREPLVKSLRIPAVAGLSC